MDLGFTDYLGQPVVSLDGYYSALVTAGTNLTLKPTLGDCLRFDWVPLGSIDQDTPVNDIVASWSPNPPPLSISGRVQWPSTLGAPNITVTLTDGIYPWVSLWTITDASGYFVFDDVECGVDGILKVDFAASGLSGGYTANQIVLDRLWSPEPTAYSHVLTLNPPPLPSVTVTAPNGGETWLQGDTGTVTWNACSSCGITSQEIQLSRGGGGWQALATLSGTPRSFDWTVTDPVSDECMIRVTATNQSGTGSDQSDGTFTIDYSDAFELQGAPILAGYTSAFSWCNYNGDGYDDLYLCGSGGDRLIGNGGGSVWSDESGVLGQSEQSRSAAWADIDNDGDWDVYLVRDGSANRLYRNDGGAYVEVASLYGVADPGPGSCAAWGDYDEDGFVDLYLGNFQGQNKLYRNLSGQGFADVTGQPENQALADPATASAVAWVDCDGDGKLELYLANFQNPNRLYKRNAGNVFEDISSGASSPASPLADPGTTAGFSWGDFDNDGDLDLALARDSSPNKLFRNDGQDAFVEITPAAMNSVRNTLQVNWVDFDNDGDLDLSLVNYGVDDGILRNVGGGVFVEGSLPTGANSLSTAAAWADYNRDGRPDFYAATGTGGVLLENVSPHTGHWLQVRVFGTEANKKGVGAWVRVSAGGTVRMRQIGGEGYLGQGPLMASFGLGAATSIDWVAVKWPGRANEQTVNSPGVDQRITITQEVGGGSGSGCKKNCPQESVTGVPVVDTALMAPAPNPFADRVQLEYALVEDQHVRMSIYDVTGRRVLEVCDGAYPAGIHRFVWDGTDESGARVSQGIYLVRMATSTGYSGTVKVLSLTR